MDVVEQNFVTFCSPGTFVSETRTKEIDSWDTTKAMEMAQSVTERHGATPYGFYFTTRQRGPDDLDSKQVARSPIYFLGGDVLTLEEVIARNNPRDKILISNMKNNSYDRVIENRNSYLSTFPLTPDDVILPFSKEPRNE